MVVGGNGVKHQHSKGLRRLNTYTPKRQVMASGTVLSSCLQLR